MATATSPYNNPAFSKYHERRDSSRRSFTSASQLESPRTLCPRDGDAFSFDRSHLPAWYVAQDLWERLPSNIKAHLASMQQAGAAVLTGYERLDVHMAQRNGGRTNTAFEDEELIAKLDALPPPKMRTVSNASSSVILSDVASPIFTETTPSVIGSPSLASSQSTNPVSPICLDPMDAPSTEKGGRSRDGSFATPLEPQDQGYAFELSYLRTEALPRLSHKSRKVETEWREAKRINDVAHHLSTEDINEFERWFVETKSVINKLYEKGKRLSDAFNLSPNGLGWTAP